MDKRQILDILTRHQVYLEGLKLGKARDFNETLRLIDADLRAAFAELRVDSMDALNKKDLLNFIIAIRRILREIYKNYVDSLYSWLQDFMTVDLEISKILYASIFLDQTVNAEDADKALETAIQESDGKPFFPFVLLSKNSDKLYSKIMNMPIPANGILPEVFVANFVASASLSIENLVRKGYVNGWTVNQTLNEITGTQKANFRDGQAARILNQNSAVIDTTMQHLSAVAQAGIGSAYYTNYQWISVLDNRTTDICRSRNGQLYIFGQGPLPPAHIR